MKILSLWQPWASLWVAGAKMIETRSWGTSYRGPVAVHASKKWDIELQHIARTEPFCSALLAAGFTGTAQLPLGAILGVVTLTDVLQMTNVDTGGSRDALDHLARHGGISLLDDPRLTDNERAFGNYAPGRYAWMTGPGRTMYGRGFPWRGAQGLRDLPDEVAAQLAGPAIAAERARLAGEREAPR